MEMSVAMGVAIAVYRQAEVKLPLAPSRVVIFRNDLLGFSYEPLGDSLALQSWVTSSQLQAA
eukprot:4715000-Amphidinium_carterae.5